jgi:hypothetical protein
MVHAKDQQMTRAVEPEKIIDSICEASAKAVRKYVEISRAKGRYLRIPEFYLPSFTFTELGSQFVMRLELNRRDALLGYDVRSVEPDEVKIRNGRIDLAVFDNDSSDAKSPLMLIEYKLWNPDYARYDLGELKRAIDGANTYPAVAIYCLVNVGVDSTEIIDLERNELTALPGAKFFKHGVPDMDLHGFEPHSVYAVLFCGVQRRPAGA